MQTNTQQQTQQKNRGPGRPPSKAAEGTPEERALKALQYSLDRANNYIQDGGPSYARRAKRAANAGIPKEVVLQGLAAMETALADARKTIEAAYAPKVKGASKVASRVKLAA